jgi:Glycosyl transferase family 90
MLKYFIIFIIFVFTWFLFKQWSVLDWSSPSLAVAQMAGFILVPLSLAVILKVFFTLMKNKITYKSDTERKAILRYARKVYGLERPSLLTEINKYAASEADEQRINYYLGENAFANRHPITEEQIETIIEAGHERLLASATELTELLQQKALEKGYLTPKLLLYKLMPKQYKHAQFLYKWGDNAHPLPLRGWIAKTRPAEAGNVTLMKLDPIRHFAALLDVVGNDRPYTSKIDKAVWRGKPTGLWKESGNRLKLAVKDDESSLFDIGFSDLAIRDLTIRDLNNRLPKSNVQAFVKGQLGMKEQLAYKVLISAEGNDVASGLKWMMASNSVVVMSRPTICSWFMEDKLQPYVHYVPTKGDYSDLEEQVNWCLDNEQKCLQIIGNAQQYVSQFLDPTREIYLEREVFRRFLDANTVSRLA